MITLDDCLAFCETPPVMVELIAKQQSVPLVLACAYAQRNMVGANDERAPRPSVPEPSRLAA